MSYLNFREKKANRAIDHTNFVEAKYSEDIENCCLNTMTYDDKTVKDIVINNRFSEKCKVELRDIDSVSAIFENKEDDETIMVLNFASYRNPGGQFLKGSMAQEECLCHESILYNVLYRQKNYYEWNNKHKNRALYLNRALYTKDVVFIKEKIDVKCDVLTCASPNASAGRQYQMVTKEENSKVLKERLDFVLKIAYDNKADTLILGAFGCGVFGQNPTEVATYFMELLEKYANCFKRVIFAIPSSKSENYIAFAKVIDNI